MRKRKTDFRFQTILILLVSIFLLSSIGYSAWSTKVAGSFITDTYAPTKKEPVAYYGKKYFATIEGALESANDESSSENEITVTVIPETNPTITRACTVGKYVTLKTPYNSSGTTLQLINSSLHNSGCTDVTDTDDKRPEFLKNTITISENITLKVEGEVQIGGVAGGAGFQGGVTNGYFTQIMLNNNSRITIDGGKLTCYGYIKEGTNSGYVDVINNGTLIVPLAIADYPGSVSNTASVASESSGTFPFDFYDIRSVSASIIIDGTSSFQTLAVVFGTRAGTNTGIANLIGSSEALIIPYNRSTSITWHYVPGDKTKTIKNDTGRMTNVTITGGASIDRIKMTLSIYTFDSSAFDLPISSYYKFDLKNGNYYLNESTKLLPGSKIIVESDSTLTVNKQLVLYESNMPNGTNTILSCPNKSAAEVQVYGTLRLNSSFSGVVTVMNDNSTGKVITGSTFSSIASTRERSAATTIFSCNNMEGKLLLYGQTVKKRLMNSSTYTADSTHWDGPGGKYSIEVINVNEGTSSFDDSLVLGSLSTSTIVEDSITLPTPSYDGGAFNFMGYFLNESLTQPIPVGEQSASNLSASLDIVNHKYFIYARWAPNDADLVKYRIDKYNGTYEITEGDVLTTIIGSSFAGFEDDRRSVEWGALGEDINIYKFNGWGAQIYESDEEDAELLYTIDDVGSSFKFDSNNNVAENNLVVFIPNWDESDSCSAPTISFNSGTDLPLNGTGDVIATVENYFDDKFTYIGGFESQDEDNVEISSTQTGTYEELIGTTAKYKCTIHNLNTSTSDEEKHPTVQIAFGLRVSIVVDLVTYTHDYGKVTERTYTKWEAKSSSCLLADSRVMTKNGVKLAKDLTIDDELLTFNHLNGQYEYTHLAFMTVERDLYDIIELTFSSGNTLKLACGHGLFNVERNRYEIYYGDEFFEHIGEHFIEVNEIDGQFVNQSTQLVNVSISREVAEKYSPISSYNINIVADNMLSIPDDIEGMFDMYNYDNDLRIDIGSLSTLINKYGIWTYDDFKDYAPEYAFEIMNFKYIKTALCSGNMTIDKVNYLLRKYLPMIVEQNNLDWDCENQKYLPDDYVSNLLNS